jgi:glycosyltransferase involved in cell wall biosynthesis
MRIGYLTYGLDRAPTGIGRYAVELLKALGKITDGPEMVVLASERDDVHDLSTTFEYHRISGCHLLPSLMTLGNIRLSELAFRHTLDAIHDPNGIAPFVALQKRVRSIVTVHDAFAYVYPHAHNWLDNWRYRWHLPYVGRRADAIVTDSQCSRKDLIAYLGLDSSKVEVIWAGIDKHFKPVTDEVLLGTVTARYEIEPPFLLYLGALNARKNVARLLEAFSRVRSRHPKMSLVIGGKRQWGSDEIDRALRCLELDGKVHFTGYVDDSDLPALYSAAEAFVFPSLYEGFGFPPLEAMACGTPVVTSNVSSLPEVVGDAAIQVDPYDVSALSQAIDRVLSDQQLRKSLRMRGIERSKLFTWKEAARQTIQLYDRVLHSAGHTDSGDSAEVRGEHQRAV